MKRKVCVVVASRANYGRVKYVLKAIQAHPDLELQLVVGASVLLDRFGNALRVIEKDGFTPTRKIYYVIDGEGKFSINGEIYSVKKEDIIAIPPNTEFVFAGKMRLLLIMNPAFRMQDGIDGKDNDLY